MRWIPAGTFTMGSPAGEAGRYPWDWEPHEVTLNEGFWLGQVPVTQALWVAVTGEKPSEFQSPERPVEQVSWNDCQRFLARVNEEVPELALRLPFEAEWEHACRAGTTTATYAGDLEILGDNNAPLLDEIAWYGGNSGVELDLEGGEDSSGWEDKQYDHARAATRLVARKRANPWGLYDMLGNVHEWCSDWWSDPERREAVRDPIGSDTGTERVIRGGSWDSYARHCRAAYRAHSEPGLRWRSIGFRLARGPEAPDA